MNSLDQQAEIIASDFACGDDACELRDKIKALIQAERTRAQELVDTLKRLIIVADKRTHLLSRVVHVAEKEVAIVAARQALARYLEE